MSYKWVYELDGVDFDELHQLYLLAPLGNKPPDLLKTVFSNSMFKCFVYDGAVLIGAGRALADGLDCSYLADVAVHPDYQGHGLGKAIMQKLVELSRGHKKIILYANPGKEGFYRKLGFYPMNTAMAIWRDIPGAIAAGLLANDDDTV